MDYITTDRISHGITSPLTDTALDYIQNMLITTANTIPRTKSKISLLGWVSVNCPAPIKSALSKSTKQDIPELVHVIIDAYLAYIQHQLTKGLPLLQGAAYHPENVTSAWDVHQITTGRGKLAMSIKVSTRLYNIECTEEMKDGLLLFISSYNLQDKYKITFMNKPVSIEKYIGGSVTDNGALFRDGIVRYVTKVGGLYWYSTTIDLIEGLKMGCNWEMYTVDHIIQSCVKYIDGHGTVVTLTK
jgi:hypothetical protein